MQEDVLPGNKDGVVDRRHINFMILSLFFHHIIFSTGVTLKAFLVISILSKLFLNIAFYDNINLAALIT